MTTNIANKPRAPVNASMLGTRIRFEPVAGGDECLLTSCDGISGARSSRLIVGYQKVSALRVTPGQLTVQEIKSHDGYGKY